MPKSQGAMKQDAGMASVDALGCSSSSDSAWCASFVLELERDPKSTHRRRDVTAFSSSLEKDPAAAEKEHGDAVTVASQGQQTTAEPRGKSLHGSEPTRLKRKNGRKRHPASTSQHRKSSPKLATLATKKKKKGVADITPEFTTSRHDGFVEHTASPCQRRRRRSLFAFPFHIGGKKKLLKKRQARRKSEGCCRHHATPTHSCLCHADEPLTSTVSVASRKALPVHYCPSNASFRHPHAIVQSHSYERDLRFVRKCFQWLIDEKAHINKVGIFRLGGVMKRVPEFYDLVHGREAEIPATTAITTVTSAVKYHFRQPNTSLFTEGEKKHLLLVFSKSEDSNGRVAALSPLLQKMSPVQLEILRVVVENLALICSYQEYNQMSVESMAIVFAPSLFASPLSRNPSLAGVAQFNSLLRFMLENATALFGSSFSPFSTQLPPCLYGNGNVSTSENESVGEEQATTSRDNDSGDDDEDEDDDDEGEWLLVSPTPVSDWKWPGEGESELDVRVHDDGDDCNGEASEEDEGEILNKQLASTTLSRTSPAAFEATEASDILMHSICSSVQESMEQPDATVHDAAQSDSESDEDSDGYGFDDEYGDDGPVYDWADDVDVDARNHESARCATRPCSTTRASLHSLPGGSGNAHSLPHIAVDVDIDAILQTRHICHYTVGKVTCSYVSKTGEELTAVEGDIVQLVDSDVHGYWLYCRNHTGCEGYLPLKCVKIHQETLFHGARSGNSNSNSNSNSDSA